MASYVGENKVLESMDLNGEIELQLTPAGDADGKMRGWWERYSGV